MKLLSFRGFDRCEVIRNEQHNETKRDEREFFFKEASALGERRNAHSVHEVEEGAQPA